MTDPRAVIEFWFAPRARDLWFKKDDAFDDEIRARFGTAIHAAQAGDFADWTETVVGALALVILIDQMARNIHRGQARAFLGDARARDIAAEAIRRGHDRRLSFSQRRFFYLPYEHSEEIADQDRSIELFTLARDEASPAERDDADIQLDYAHRHRDIIRRFGRYPHRNAALGRISVEAEVEFLKEPGSSF